MLLAITLIGTLIVGNVLYYFSGILRKMGAISSEEMNESEMFVTKHGELEEIFPKELMTEREVNYINFISRILFILISMVLWMIMGLTAGRIAYLLEPTDLWKLISYIILYFFILRIPFGIINRTIEKSFEVKLMPDKLAFALVAIISYLIGINYYEYLPGIMKFHLQNFG